MIFTYHGDEHRPLLLCREDTTRLHYAVRALANNGFKDKERTVWFHSCEGSLRALTLLCLGLKYRDMKTAYTDAHILL